MDGNGIRPIGLSYGGQGYSDEQVQRHWLKISQAATLQDLAKDYAWFSLGLMYGRVQLGGRDPWGDYVNEAKAEPSQLTMRFSKPIFRGMEIGHDVEFNHVLWAMPLEQWEDYQKWMASLTFVDRGQQLATRLRTQEIEIADPLFFERAVVMPANCPTVRITVFALDSNQGCIYVQPGQHPLMDLPRVVQSTTTMPDTRAWATALFNGHPDPFGVSEPLKGEDPFGELMERVRKIRESDED